MVTQLIYEVSENRGELSVLCLDLATLMDLIHTSLVAYLEKIHELIQDYYGSFRLRFTSGNVKTSAWYHIEKSIITGCTISVVLFTLAMHMLVKAAEAECRDPLSLPSLPSPDP